jgi:VWFA-related protein
MKQADRRRFSWLGVLLLVVAAGTVRSSGQQTPPGRTLAVGSEVVTVDFIALTRDGQPILDLKLEEVTLRVSGRARTLKSLQLVTPSGAGAPASATAAAAGATPAPVPEPPSGDPPPPPYGTNTIGDSGRSIALVVDDESMRPNNEGPMRAAIAQFLDSLAPNDQVALATVPHGKIRTNFTTDHDAVKREATTIMGQAEQNETGSQACDRTRVTLSALIGTIETLGRGVGPTTFILFSSNLLSENSAPRAIAGVAAGANAQNIGNCDLRPEEFQRVGAAAIAARANFYFIQHDPAINGIRSGIDNLAGVTGGHINWSGRIDEALARVGRETAAYYVATFEPDPGERTGNPQQMTVRVSRPNTEVRTRPDLVIGKTGDSSAARQSSANPQAMIVDSRPFTELPIRIAGYSYRNTPDGQLKVIAIGEIIDPAGTIQGAAAGLFDQAGRLMAQAAAKPDETGRRFVTLALLAPPGTYRLRMALTDAAGQRGLAEYEVTSELVPAGPLKLSAIVLGVSRPVAGADGQFMFVPVLHFKNETSAIAQFEVYSSQPSGGGGRVVMEVASSLNGKRMFEMPALVSQTSESDKVTVTTTIPVGLLDPGDYVIRAIVGMEGHPDGRVVRTLRKTR